MCCLILLSLSLMCPLKAHGQKRTIVERVDSLLSLFNSAPHDSAYMAKPSTKWMIRALGNVGNTSTYLHLVPMDDSGMFRADLRGKVRHTMTLSANYRGLSASVSFNPAVILGKRPSLQLNLSAYSNHYGVEVHYENLNRLSGKASRMDYSWAMDNAFDQNTLTISGYWAFNYKRFSYPAAFTQSWIQKKSAGSVMLGAMYNSSTMFLDESNWDLLNVKDSEMRTLAVGAGYAYNFVPRQKWLIHGSLIPMLMLWNEKVIHGTTSGRVLGTSFPEFSVRGTLAVVRYYDRFFLGGNLLYVYTYSKLEKGMNMINGRWRTRLLVGVRF